MSYVVLLGELLDWSVEIIFATHPSSLLLLSLAAADSADAL